MVAVYYSDRGPKGPCGQAKSITRHWHGVYLFDDYRQACEFAQEYMAKVSHRRSPAVEIIDTDAGDTIQDRRTCK